MERKTGSSVGSGRAPLCTGKAYDTRSNMSHTTCWIRQNLRMSDRVSPHKTPHDTIRQCCKIRKADVFNFYPTPTNFVEWANQSNDRYLYT